MEIIRGTTPTIQFTFDTISPGDITTAYLVVRQNGADMIEKTLEDATIVEGKLSFRLSQSDTLALEEKPAAYVSLDWLTGDGTRGRSKVYKADVTDSGKDEVI